MKLPLLFLLATAGSPILAATHAHSDPMGHDVESEAWRAWLVLGEEDELPFGLELRQAEQGWRAFLVNGEERIEVPQVARDDRRLLLEMPHYDSLIRATFEEDGRSLRGEWEKVRGKDRVARVPFRARRGPAPRFEAQALGVPPVNVTGRWRVDFESDELPAVGLFQQADDDTRVTGTFLTATGDYRFLAGSTDGDRLRLSCFDGAHAFLFDARLAPDGTLSGVFHSGDWWQETWTARRDAAASLGNAFEQTTWDERASLAELAFPDTEGELRSLAHRRYAGRARIVQLFGSWCPNCHDETRYLVELHERYAARGLSIVGLAFELTGDFERDAGQVRAFRDRHAVPYPLLVVGTADKQAASQAFPAIDRLRSYPTTIFLHSDGRVRSVHSGFAGPATGDAHRALRSEYEGLIEELLAEPTSAFMDEVWSALEATPWSSTQPLPGGADELRFSRRADGGPQALGNAGPPLPVELVGDAVWVGDGAALPYRYDPRAGVLRHPADVGHRLYPSGGSRTPRITAETLEVHLAGADPVLRREALLAWTLSRPVELGRLETWARDSDPGVRSMALWAAGELGAHELRGALEELLEHPDGNLRREAARALSRLESAPR